MEPTVGTSYNDLGSGIQDASPPRTPPPAIEPKHKQNPNSKDIELTLRI
jgi:hypothetical protein